MAGFQLASQVVGQAAGCRAGLGDVVGGFGSADRRDERVLAEDAVRPPRVGRLVGGQHRRCREADAAAVVGHHGGLDGSVGAADADLYGLVHARGRTLGHGPGMVEKGLWVGSGQQLTACMHLTARQDKDGENGRRCCLGHRRPAFSPEHG